jgi:Family of unknown function (DUF6325)
MTLGPIDVVIIAFPGNKFSGRIAPAVLDLVNSGTIRVVDLLFVSKAADGAVTTVDAADLEAGEGPGYQAIEVLKPGALGIEDAEEISDDLSPETSALLIAFENTWAASFVDACRAADAMVIDQIRIPADVGEAVIEGTGPLTY